MRQQILLNKNTPSDLSIVGRNINDLNGTYMVVTGHFVRYQSDEEDLNLKIEIDSLKDKNFNASFGISPEVTKSLSALSKGKRDVTFYGHENNQSYVMTNQHINVTLDYVDAVNLGGTFIEDSLKDAKQIGPPVNISSLHELSITGKEETVSLIVRDGTFSGIISSFGEYFFDPDHREEAGVVTAVPQSEFFLKIGKENFILSLYYKENNYLLLTEVSIGLGIKCQMLEILIPQ